MRNILSVLLVFLFVASCSKEVIESKIDTLPNYYEITNSNPNDPVELKRYELYRDYGVPVFFNDTIAKVLVQVRPTGDSIFRYERVDLNWSFSGNSIGTYRYVHDYFTTEKDRLAALNIVEEYLKSASKPLRPFCVLLTKLTQRIIIKTGEFDETYKREGYQIGYRAMLIHSINSYNTPEKRATFIDLLKRQMVTNRLANYEKELTAFGGVSDPKWYGKSFTAPVTANGLGVVWDSSHVMRKYSAAGVFQYEHQIELTAMRIKYAFYERDYPEESAESIEGLRQNVRKKIGIFGFVGPKPNNTLDSYPVSEELQVFLAEILGTDLEEFTRRWGDSPLVMKKYQILYDIIKDKLEIEL